MCIHLQPKPIEEHQHAVRMLERARTEGLQVGVSLWHAAERRLRLVMAPPPRLARPGDVSELESLWLELCA